MVAPRRSNTALSSHPPPHSTPTPNRLEYTTLATEPPAPRLFAFLGYLWLCARVCGTLCVTCGRKFVTRYNSFVVLTFTLRYRTGYSVAYRTKSSLPYTV